jgi:hypothetical protein
MIWMTWRQHRAAAAGAVALLLACAAALVPLGASMHHTFTSLHLGRCAGTAPGPFCATAFQNLAMSGVSNQLTPWLILVPLLMGVLAGAPLVAREMEAGTYRLAWVQATTRARWITVKLGLLALGVALASGAFAWLVTWWRQPIDSLSTNAAQGRFGSFVFGVEGTVVVGYALFAFFLGVLAGSLARRTILAVVTAAATFIAVMMIISFLVRPHYLPPVSTLTAFPVSQSASFTPDTTASPGDWLLHWGLVAPNGHQLASAQINADMLSAYQAHVPISIWLRDHGIRHLLVYQPASRFWTFQLIETGIYLAMSAALAIAVTWHALRRLP